MPRYIDVEGYRKLFDEEYKKTRELIFQGKTHLDNIAEGFCEAGRVIDRIPTADVVPKSEVENLKNGYSNLRGECKRFMTENETLQREYDILKSLITRKEEEAYNKGYEDGKADMQVEVAIKIFAEIELILYKLLPPKVFHLFNGDTVGNSFDLGKDKALHEALNEIAEHRKKYTEVKNENT